ncbi:DNA alkylation repair protein [Caldalkalibacillus salinus]|uniref:DNA alkylation repair protein n=1 Tax=Caldalkalibacillus salinus TaxID=2803787 RepID=UPI001922D2A5|nr:DNA alkylation repair protein [Caldalkalibacillus salinus]
MPFYCCPTCQARSRFNVIEQHVTPIKIDFATGEESVLDQLEPFHIQYQGPDKRIQCGSCGQVDEEVRFVKMAERMRQQ